MLHSIAIMSPCHLDRTFVFSEAVKTLENNTFAAGSDANNIIWGVVICLLGEDNYRPILPLLQLPRYKKHQGSLLPALARAANIDVGDGFGVEEVVR